VVVEHDGEGRF